MIATETRNYHRSAVHAAKEIQSTAASISNLSSGFVQTTLYDSRSSALFGLRERYPKKTIALVYV